jgi:two-component system NtrC family sensor kinase
MVDLVDLAHRFAEATDVGSAAELLAEHVAAAVEGGACRVYLLGPGDRCSTCPRAKECPARDRCLHLEGGVGSFAAPPGHVERVPRVLPPWDDVLRGQAHGPVPAPREVEAPEGEDGEAHLLPLSAAGAAFGVMAFRARSPLSPDMLETVTSAAHLAAATFRFLASRDIEGRRHEQLMLVNELGRKVNAILNDDLLLRQAAVDIHRSFGFHNVMIFMLDAARTRLVLKAQASRWPSQVQPDAHLALHQGIVGRVSRAGITETVDDVSTDVDFVKWFVDTRSEIAVPIQINGVVEGVLNVESDQIGAFGPTERLVLETVANQLAIAIENARLFSMVKEREDRYRTLVESSPGAVLHLDPEGRIIYANPAVSDISGFEKGQLLTQLRGLPDLTSADDRPRVSDAVARSLRGYPLRDLEFHLVRPDGSLRWVSASLQPLISEQGEPRGVVVLARDQTDERELQDRLQQSEKLSAIGHLVSGVAHELNNPLAGILGFAQLLLGRPTEEWSRGDIEKIEKNARRCQRIVENLLAFARQSRMTKRMANMNEVIESVIRLNEYQFRMDNIEIQRSFDPRTPSMPLDVNRWQQVFINLAGNARDALIAANSPRRVIRFETRVMPLQLIVRVSDTGPGIPERVRPRVFEPFFTTKDTGTGLGLGICWGIVRDHGGTIELEPPFSGGATFRISLPVSVPDEVVPEPEAMDGPSHSEAGAGKRVLVVDDDPSVCDVVAQTLHNHGYRVDVTHDGRSGLERMQATSYDAVLTDVRMPGEIDGFGLYDRVRSQMPWMRDRVVFLTGNVLDSATMGRLSRLGVECVEKPFDIGLLARIVNRVAGEPVTERPPGTPARGGSDLG